MVDQREPIRARRDGASGERLAGDDRGAIMVMGIFMCVFLVGALWYIAGVGDVLLYRERVQEASDSVAFSTAVLEARGMNMLVMINLIMAAVEAVLVALNIVIYAVAAVSIALLALGAALSWLGVGEALIAAGTELGNFDVNVLKKLHDNVVQPAVDKSLKALHQAWHAIPPLVPVAAEAAGMEMASFYAPAVQTVAGAAIFVQGGKPLLTMSLPVEDGSTHVLCMKAFKAIEGLLNDFFPDLGSIAIDPLTSLINAIGVSDVFCELGDSGSPPDAGKLVNKLGSSNCDSNQTIKDQCQAASDAQAKASRVAAACANWDPNANPPQKMPDPDCPNVQALQDDASSKQDECDKQQKKCQDGVKDATNKANQVSTPSQGSGDGKQPSRVKHNEWWNGGDMAQILAVEHSDGTFVTYSPKFVHFASQNGITMNDPSETKGQKLGLSQAEFFYDAPGDWDTVDAQEEAMWNFHWRARFRLFNPGIFGPEGVLLYGIEGEMVVKIGKDGIHKPSLIPAKVQFEKDLTSITPPLSMVLH